jgi:predicted small lipoprotein YifL
MKTWRLLLTSILLSTLLGGCGLKGPLYLPESEAPAGEVEKEPEEEDGTSP